MKKAPEKSPWKKPLKKAPERSLWKNLQKIFYKNNQNMSLMQESDISDTRSSTSPRKGATSLKMSSVDSNIQSWSALRYQ